MSKDWKGNSNSIYKTLGASNHCEKEREENDFYATNPKALDILFDEGKLVLPTKDILEPACGQGHISKKLEERGYNVTSYDLIDRGYGEVKDFFDIDKWDGSIVTNPPYSIAQRFVEHAMEIIPEGQEVVMYLKLTFLEGKARKEMFKKCPLKELYVMSSRMGCSKGGTEENFVPGAVAYGFFVFQKGYTGLPAIKWIN